MKFDGWQLLNYQKFPFRRLYLLDRSKLNYFVWEIKMSTLGIINPDSAGIDVGSEFHYVCVPDGRFDPRVRNFACFTNDLNRLADWLTECRVNSVAMESTGVYWIPLYEILTARGFEVTLANAKYVKNVPGRKTDVQDCAWLQQLHSYGLLQGSFIPDQLISELRGYMRQRVNLVKGAAAHVQRMQKSLTQMNLQLHKVISDITGETGLKIIGAILDGERNPLKLAQLRSGRIHKGEEAIAQALVGNYRADHLFSLRQEHDLYLHYQTKIAECDKQVLEHYAKFESKDKSLDNEAKPENVEAGGNAKSKESPKFNLRRELQRITGVDFTKIPGLDVLSIQSIIAETGLDPSKWPTEKHFSSWLGLSPANKITGGKVYSTRTRKVNSRAATVFRTAAVGAGKSKTALGAFYRRLKSRSGAMSAITATARKLACMFYSLLKNGNEYVEKGMTEYEDRYHDRVVKNLTRRAKELGLSLVPAA